MLPRLGSLEPKVVDHLLVNPQETTATLAELEFAAEDDSQCLAVGAVGPGGGGQPGLEPASTQWSHRRERRG